METLETTDVNAISAAIQQVLGVDMEEIMLRGRMVQDRYPAKVAFCRLLKERGYGSTTIARIMNIAPSGVALLVQKHYAMLEGNILYRRVYTALKERLK